MVVFIFFFINLLKFWSSSSFLISLRPFQRVQDIANKCNSVRTPKYWLTFSCQVFKKYFHQLLLLKQNNRFKFKFKFKFAESAVFIWIFWKKMMKESIMNCLGLPEFHQSRLHALTKVPATSSRYSSCSKKAAKFYRHWHSQSVIETN